MLYALPTCVRKILTLQDGGAPAKQDFRNGVMPRA
jgi:hypothetical protein